MAKKKATRPKKRSVKSADKTAGHDAATGRFVPGNPGGPGRPPRETEVAYLDVFRATITPEELAVVLVKLLDLAKSGDCRAAEIILKRTVPEKLLVDAAVQANVTTVAEPPPDILALYADRPDIMERALQLEVETYDAWAAMKAGGNPNS